MPQWQPNFHVYPPLSHARPSAHQPQQTFMRLSASPAHPSDHLSSVHSPALRSCISAPSVHPSGRLFCAPVHPPDVHLLTSPVHPSIRLCGTHPPTRRPSSSHPSARPSDARRLTRLVIFYARLASPMGLYAYALIISL